MTGQNTGVVNGLRTAIIIMAIGLGALASLATVLAFFGGVWWGFDLAANFRWQLMWSALIAAVIYALASRGIATIIFVAAVAVNAWLVAPLWLGSQPEATGEDGTKIVAVDVFGGSTDEQATLQWLFDTEADLIIASGASSNRLGALASDGSPYRVLAAPVEQDRAGIVILAVDDYAVSAVTTETLGQRIFTVTVPVAGGSVDIVTAWGQLATSETEADELAERLSAVEEIVATSTNEVAVVGNLGATRFTEGMRSMVSTTGLPRCATEGSRLPRRRGPSRTSRSLGGWIGIPDRRRADVARGSPRCRWSTGPDIGVATPAGDHDHGRTRRAESTTRRPVRSPP